MTNSKELEFANLFQQFLKSYPYTSAGLRHVAAFDEWRQQISRILAHSNSPLKRTIIYYLELRIYSRQQA